MSALLKESNGRVKDTGNGVTPPSGDDVDRYAAGVHARSGAEDEEGFVSTGKAAAAAAAAAASTEDRIEGAGNVKAADGAGMQATSLDKVTESFSSFMLGKGDASKGDSDAKEPSSGGGISRVLMDMHTSSLEAVADSPPGDAKGMTTHTGIRRTASVDTVPPRAAHREVHDIAKYQMDVSRASLAPTTEESPPRGMSAFLDQKQTQAYGFSPMHGGGGGGGGSGSSNAPATPAVAAPAQPQDQQQQHQEEEAGTEKSETHGQDQQQQSQSSPQQQQQQHATTKQGENGGRASDGMEALNPLHVATSFGQGFPPTAPSQGGALSASASASAGGMGGDARISGGDDMAFGHGGVLNQSMSPTGGQVTLACPPHLVGRVIGRKGDTIQRLQEMTATRIVIDQNVPQNAPRQIIISGPTIHAVSSSAQLVQEVMLHGPPWRHKIMPSAWSAPGGHHGSVAAAAAAASASSVYSQQLLMSHLARQSVPGGGLPGRGGGGSIGGGGSSGGGVIGGGAGVMPQPSGASPVSPGSSGSGASWQQPQQMQYPPMSGQSPATAASYAQYYHAAAAAAGGGAPSGSQMPPAGGWMHATAWNSGWPGTGAFYPPHHQGGSPSSPGGVGSTGGGGLPSSQSEQQSRGQSTGSAGQLSTDVVGQAWQECRTPDGYVTLPPLWHLDFFLPPFLEEISSVLCSWGVRPIVSEFALLVLYTCLTICSIGSFLQWCVCVVC